MASRRTLLWCIVLLTACTGEDDSQTNSSSFSSTQSAYSSSLASSSSSVASSSSSVGITYGCGICAFDGVEDFPGSLLVITPAHYQAKLDDVLGEGAYGEYETAALAPFSGRALFAEEHADQRWEIATETFYRAAQNIAATVTAVSCNNISAEDCGALFIESFVEPLFERQLTNQEQDFYIDFFRNAHEPQEDGQQAAMTAALSSPHFLFRKQEVADDE